MTSTSPDGSTLAAWDMRTCAMLPASLKAHVAGSKSSALVRISFHPDEDAPLPPPITSTWPPGSDTATWPERGVFMFPDRVNEEVAGSKISALLRYPPSVTPPITTARPSGKALSV